MKGTFGTGDIHGGLKTLKQVMNRAAVRAFDTLILEFWQSDPLPALHPGEKGRNRD
jgi:hypothetical protein